MKRKIALLAILALTLTFMGAGFAEAVTSQATVTLGATVSSSASLSLANTTVTFPNVTPPGVINAAENGAIVTATFRTATSTPGTLMVLSTDLTDAPASDVIPVTAISSTATNTSGGFFTAGPVTWSKTGNGAQVGTGPSGSYAGTFSWSLANSWTYATGVYTGSAVYTLTAP